jgi:hypothetical protein
MSVRSSGRAIGYQRPVIAPYRILVPVLVVAGLLAVGCGEEEQAAAPAATRTAEPTETPTPTPGATDFIEDLHRDGRRQVAVDYQKPDCWVLVPLGARRLSAFVAPGGKGNYHNPERIKLGPGEGVTINASTRPDGRIAAAG